MHWAKKPKKKIQNRCKHNFWTFSDILRTYSLSNACPFQQFFGDLSTISGFFDTLGRNAQQPQGHSGVFGSGFPTTLSFFVFFLFCFFFFLSLSLSLSLSGGPCKWVPQMGVPEKPGVSKPPPPLEERPQLHLLKLGRWSSPDWSGLAVPECNAVVLHWAKRRTPNNLI